jgi:surfeit locus 1 family protein
VRAPAEPLPRRRGIFGPAIVVLAAFLILIALGTWQLQRKAWKEGLIADIDRRSAAAPVGLPRPETWPQLRQEDDEFRRVKLTAELRGGEAFVYTSGSSLRPDIKAPGYFVFSPARLPDGRVVVINRGYVGLDRQLSPSVGSIDVIGYLRWPEPRHWLFPDEERSDKTWIVRDHRAMAARNGWGDVGPFYIDQEAPVPDGGLPRPGPIRPSLPNNHLGYALTWYGLAAVLAAVFAAWLHGRGQGASPTDGAAGPDLYG